MFERTEQLIGTDNLNKIKNTNVLIIGVGGVGGSALEALVRSGIGNITIIDYDTVDISNLNRQIISNQDNIGHFKVEEAKKRCLMINSELNINAINMKLDKTNIDLLDKFDYIIDACDSIEAKVELIKHAFKTNTKIITSCGMGNRLDPSKVYITKLSKTENDPLAKKLRNELRSEKIPLNTTVVASKEIPIKSKIINSMMMVPATAGLHIAHYIIDTIIKSS